MLILKAFHPDERSSALIGRNPNLWQRSENAVALVTYLSNLSTVLLIKLAYSFFGEALTCSPGWMSPKLRRGQSFLSRWGTFQSLPDLISQLRFISFLGISVDIVDSILYYTWSFREVFKWKKDGYIICSSFCIPDTRPISALPFPKVPVACSTMTLIWFAGEWSLLGCRRSHNKTTHENIIPCSFASRPSRQHFEFQ